MFMDELSSPSELSDQAEAQVPTVNAGGVSSDEPATPESQSPTWCIAVVRRNSEKVCRDILLSEGYEAYVATQTLMVRHVKKPIRPVEYVRIPAKVFVRLQFSHTRESTAFCIAHPFINRLMTDPARTFESTGIPRLAEVPDREIRRLRDMLDDRHHEVTFGDLDSTFSIDGPVRVAFGPLRDTEGTLARRKGKSYFVIQTQFLNCARILVSPSEVEPVDNKKR